MLQMRIPSHELLIELKKKDNNISLLQLHADPQVMQLAQPVIRLIQSLFGPPQSNEDEIMTSWARSDSLAEKCKNLALKFH